MRAVHLCGFCSGPYAHGGGKHNRFVALACKSFSILSCAKIGATPPPAPSQFAQGAGGWWDRKTWAQAQSRGATDVRNALAPAAHTILTVSMCFPREPRDVSRCVPRHEVATLACMDVLISHNSAFALYDALDDATLAHRRTMPLESFGWDYASARTHPLVAALPQPLDVLVPFGARVETDTACLHASTQKLPPLSTLPLAPHLYTVAPEICLFQLARGARAIDIAQRASRLMSTYRTCTEAPSGIAERTQLTSPRKIAHYVRAIQAQSTRSATHSVAFNRAMEWVSPGAASPREAALQLIFTVHARSGGFGLPKPELNYTVRIPAPLVKWAGKRSYRCDLYWPQAAVAVEYDSDLHTGSRQIAKDAKRREVLARLGITTITVTRIQMNNVEELRQIALHVSKLLGTPKRYQSLELRERQHKLLGSLLHSKWL